MKISLAHEQVAFAQNLHFAEWFIFKTSVRYQELYLLKFALLARSVIEPQISEILHRKARTPAAIFARRIFLVVRKPGRMSNESQTKFCVCVCHSIIPRKYAIKTPFLPILIPNLIIAYGILSPPLLSGKIEIKRKFVEGIRSWNGWWCWFCKCSLQLQHRSLLMFTQFQERIFRLDFSQCKISTKTYSSHLLLGVFKFVIYCFYFF